MSAVVCLSLKALRLIRQAQEVTNFRGVCLRSTNQSCSIIPLLTNREDIEHPVIVAICATQRFTPPSVLRLLTFRASSRTIESLWETFGKTRERCFRRQPNFDC